MSLYDEMEATAAQANEAPQAAATVIPAPACPDAELASRIRSLTRNFSIEVLPKTAGKIKQFADHLPTDSKVFIPFLPGAAFQDSLPLAIRLRREGMEPVPHIAARRLRSRAELTETLGRLRSEADVSRCLVIAGDPDRPDGPFADSMAVLETGLLEEHGIETIYVGGQPEGIAGVAPEDIEAALIRKNAYALSTNASLRLITQFTLNVRALTAWQARLNELGNRLPVHIGIAGPTSLATLLRFAALTGASASIRAMRRYGAKLTQLASETAPDSLITYLASQQSPCSAEAQPNQAIAGLHVYTFGGFQQSSDWMMAVSNGDFSLKPRGKGFDVSLARSRRG
jgi:methylenetetrahydrofolate reductase (NADPH)